MSFKVVWTNAGGSKEVVKHSAKEALAEWIARKSSSTNVVITDDHGRRVTPVALKVLADGIGEY